MILFIQYVYQINHKIADNNVRLFCSDDFFKTRRRPKQLAAQKTVKVKERIVRFGVQVNKLNAVVQRHAAALLFITVANDGYVKPDTMQRIDKLR